MEQELDQQAKQEAIPEQKETEIPKNTEILTAQDTGTPFIRLAMAAFAGGILAALIIIGWQWFFPAAQSTVLTVDTKQIINYKVSQMREKYKGAYTEANAKAAEDEVLTYMAKVQSIIDSFSKKTLVLVKEAVPSNQGDITSRIIAVVEGSTADKIQAEFDKLSELERLNTPAVAPLPMPLAQDPGTRR